MMGLNVGLEKDVWDTAIASSTILSQSDEEECAVEEKVVSSTGVKPVAPQHHKRHKQTPKAKDLRLQI